MSHHHHRRPDRRRHHKRAANALEHINKVIAQTGLLLPSQRLNYLAPINSALAMFRTGHGSPQLLANLVDGMNVAMELCKLRICNDRRGLVETALARLIKINARAATSLDWAITDDEIEALEEGVFIHTVQVDHCSVSEFDAAVRAVVVMTIQASRGHLTPGVTVVDPLSQGAHASEAAALAASN